MGKKPLYYTTADDRFYFSSELKSIKRAISTQPDINLAAVSDFLSQQYVSAPMTIWRDWFALPPGHFLELSFNPAPGTQTPVRYWEFPSPSAGPSRGDRQEFLRELEHRLLQAVSNRLIADVPIGVFLSGGLDSSSLVALASRTGPRRLKTFSIGFDSAEFDESDYALEVAEAFDCEHQDYRISKNDLDRVPQILTHFDQPFADSSSVPYYILCEMASSGLTVALAGDGGDELFYGYPRYQTCRRLQNYERVPGWLSRIAEVPRSLLPESWVKQKLRLLASANMPRARRYADLVEYFSDSEKDRAFGAAFDEQFGSSWENLDEHFESEALFWKGANRVDWLSYLPNDLLVKADMMAMAHGVEIRSPFLDVDLIEWVSGQTEYGELSLLDSKWALRETMRADLPRSVLQRRKQGFEVPLKQWLLGPLHDVMMDTVPGGKITTLGLVNADYVEGQLDAIKSHRSPHDEKLAKRMWALFVLELWLRDTC